MTRDNAKHFARTRRACLLAGASAAALLLGLSQADAQTTTIDPAATPGAPGSGVFTQNGAGATSQIANGGLFTGFAGLKSTQIGGDTLTASNSLGGLTTVSSTGMSTNGLVSTTGGLSVTGGTTTDTLKVNTTSTFVGLATFQNGVSVTGGDLAVANNATVGGTFTSTGLITGTGGANLSGGVTIDTLTVTNGQTVNGGSTINGGQTVNNGFTANGGSTLNGGATVNGGFTANGGSTLNGGATVNGNTQLNGNFAIAPGNSVNLGGGEIQGVGTPILPTDAANKAYVDRSFNKANEGTALALAISQPIFLPGQSFAIRAGWGDFEGQNAFGVSAAGVISRDMFGYGSTVTVDAGVGVGSNYNQVAGKAGVTFGFGSCCAPLK